MQVTSSTQNRELFLWISGEVDHHAAAKIMGEVERLVEERLPRSFILDMSGVTFMDSSGIAVVLRCHQRMVALGGALVVRNIPAQALKVLRAAGLERMITFE